MRLRQLSLTLCTSHRRMNHTACVMNLPVWTFPLSVLFMRLSYSQRAAGQGQQETNSRQSNSPLMHEWFSRRSYSLGLLDEMGHEAAVICTIKSSCFSSKPRLEMFSADIQSQSLGSMTGSSHWKTRCSRKSYKCHAWDSWRLWIGGLHIAPEVGSKDGT